MFNPSKTLVLYRKNPLPTTLLVTIGFLFFVVIGVFAEFDRSQGEHIFYYVIISIYALLGIVFYIGMIPEYIKYKKEVPIIYIENDILHIDKTLFTQKKQIPFFQIKEAKMGLDPNNKNTISIKYYPGIVPQYIVLKDEYHIDLDTILKIILDTMK